MIPVLAPLVLGIATALAFLFHYLGKNRAVVTIRNRTGYDLVGGQLRISSQPKEQEVGEIKDGDSAKVLFERFGDGHYIFAGQFKHGKTLQDSGGSVASGASYKDEILLESRNDTLVAEVSRDARD
ncbi:MAG TPA: hypothetical protein VJ385_07695 [Fibrobacteria bacterium]|nr:hypothetical protein [Fibrobacteria bacterium]